jgi:dihydrofolate reductase
MGVIGTALSMSLDGFIAGQDGGAAGLHDWLTDGETPSRFSPVFKMASPSAEFFDEGVAGTGAVVAGRRTYDVSGAWGGRGPVPGVPLVVLTHQVPGSVPAGDPPYTFVTDGIEAAVAGNGGRRETSGHAPTPDDITARCCSTRPVCR